MEMSRENCFQEEPWRSSGQAGPPAQCCLHLQQCIISSAIPGEQRAQPQYTSHLHRDVLQTPSTAALTTLALLSYCQS